MEHDVQASCWGVATRAIALCLGVIGIVYLCGGFDPLTVVVR